MAAATAAAADETAWRSALEQAEHTEHAEHPSHHASPRTERFENDTVRDRAALQRIVASLAPERCRYVARALVLADNLIQHQMDSYERFMHVLLPHIVHENSTIVVDSESTRRRHVVEFGNVVLYRPSVRESSGAHRTVLPYECRVRNLTYAVSVTVDVRYTVYDTSALDAAVVAAAAAANTASSAEERAHEARTRLPLCDTRQYREVLLCQVPAMLRSRYCHLYESAYASRECPHDRGGAFVINGSEKHLIMQEKMLNNRAVVRRESSGKYAYVCEVRSLHESKLRSTSTLCCYLSSATLASVLSACGASAALDAPYASAALDAHAHASGAAAAAAAVPEVAVVMPFVEFDTPVSVLFRLLGVRDASEMRALVLEHAPRAGDALACDEPLERLVDAVFAQHDATYGDMSNDDLADWIGRRAGSKDCATRDKRLKYLHHIVSNEVLPHVGLERSEAVTRRKQTYLALMVYRLCAVALGREQCDDRDHVAAKEVDGTGVLLAVLFRPQCRTMLKNAAMYIRRNAEAGKVINVADAINHKRITSAFKYALSTGNWGPQKGGSPITGVAQVHTRMTVCATLSNMRRVMKQINKDGKVPRPRQLPPSAWGIYCPVETPEGASCGLSQNLALGARMRVGCDVDYLLERLRRLPGVVTLERSTHTERCAYTALYVNGALMAYARDGAATVRTLREYRRACVIPHEAALVYAPSRRTLHLNTHGGCCVRPLFALRHAHRFEALYARYASERVMPPREFVAELLCAGVLEYVSKEEEYTLRVAVRVADLLDERRNSATDREPYTHVEVHALLLLGVCASLIPFSNHSQAPRNMYQCAMSKQCAAYFALNNADRFDSLTHTLCYPQQPLVQTWMERVLGGEHLCSGQNVTVAVACFTGYNRTSFLLLYGARIYTMQRRTA